MRNILFCGIVAMFIALVSCDKPVEERQYQFPAVELNHCADTSINGQTFQFCFDSVYDSRCPANMECVWQGEATVKLSMQIGANQKQFFKLSTINHPLTFKSDTTISGYHIKLVSVSPYPGDGSNSPYRIELSVSK